MLDRYPQARGYCIDLSRPSLDAASTLLEAKGFADRAKLWQASYLDPIRVPEPVDLALAIGTIHHCPDPARALANIAAAVKPGGHVACMVYGMRGHRRRYEIKEAIAMLAGDLTETEALYRSYQAKYNSLLDTTPRKLIRNARDRASHVVNRALRRKRHGYRTDQQTSVFILDAVASPIDVGVRHRRPAAPRRSRRAGDRRDVRRRPARSNPSARGLELGQGSISGKRPGCPSCSIRTRSPGRSSRGSRVEQASCNRARRTNASAPQ